MQRTGLASKTFTHLFLVTYHQFAASKLAIGVHPNQIHAIWQLRRIELLQTHFIVNRSNQRARGAINAHCRGAIAVKTYLRIRRIRE